MSALWQFVFTWKIENWNTLFPWELDSPVFKVHQLPHKRWHLKLIRGRELSRINLQLCRSRDGYGDQDVPVMIGTHTEVVFFKTRIETASGSPKISQRSEPMRVRDRLTLFDEPVNVTRFVDLDGRVLTLRCTLSNQTRIEPDPERELSELERTLSELEHLSLARHLEPPSVVESCSASGAGSLRCRPDSCTARTRIELFRRSFEWVVKGLDLKSPSWKSAIRIESAQTNFGSLELTLCYGNAQPPRLWFEVRRTVPDYSKRTFVTCSFTFVKKDHSLMFFAREDHLFSGGEDDPWVVKSSIHDPPDKLYFSSKARRNWVRKLVHEDQDIRIEVELIASHEGCHRHLVGPPANALDDADRVLMSEFRGLPQDIVLVSGDGKEVRASRIILSARSPVFQRMLMSDMAEGRSGTVPIPDLDAEVLESMVTFMHGKRLDLTPEVAVGLYSAADRYELPSLRALCSAFLCSGATIETAPDAMRLAKVYEDRDLMSSDKDFVLSNLPRVLLTESGKRLLLEYPEFAKKTAGEVMRKWPKGSC